MRPIRRDRDNRGDKLRSPSAGSQPRTLPPWFAKVAEEPDWDHARGAPAVWRGLWDAAQRDAERWRDDAPLGGHLAEAALSEPGHFFHKV